MAHRRGAAWLLLAWQRPKARGDELHRGLLVAQRLVDAATREGRVGEDGVRVHEHVLVVLPAEGDDVRRKVAVRVVEGVVLGEHGEDVRGDVQQPFGGLLQDVHTALRLTRVRQPYLHAHLEQRLPRRQVAPARRQLWQQLLLLRR